MNKNPRIQILLATFNGEIFLRGQLDSIINQEYKSWELLIHDDGSIDNTVMILNEYETNYPKKVKLLDQMSYFSQMEKYFSFKADSNKTRDIITYINIFAKTTLSNGVDASSKIKDKIMANMV